MTESSAGETRYLLSDGLGSVRQAMDDNGSVVVYNEFDPYGNSIANRKSSIVNPYGFTGEWWQDEVELLHLRARWYMPGTGTFLSRDPVESEPPYQYVQGNPINLIDPSGLRSSSNTSAATESLSLVPSGYFEGYVASGTAANCIVAIRGKEVAYNFNTGEKAVFEYTSEQFSTAYVNIPVAGVNLFDNFGVDVGFYSGYLWGFSRNFIGNPAGIDEYDGRAVTFNTGLSLELPTAIPAVSVAGDIGLTGAIGNPVKGFGLYAGLEGSIGAPFPFDLSAAVINVEEFRKETYQKYNIYESSDMAYDIKLGIGSPMPFEVLGSSLPIMVIRSGAADTVKQYAPDEEWGDLVPPAAPLGFDTYVCQYDGRPAHCQTYGFITTIFYTDMSEDELKRLQEQRKVWREENPCTPSFLGMSLCPAYPPHLLLPSERVNLD